MSAIQSYYNIAVRFSFMLNLSIKECNEIPTRSHPVNNDGVSLLSTPLEVMTLLRNLSELNTW